MPVDSHYEPETIERFLRSELSEAESRNVEQHIELCDTCRQQLAETAADDGWWNEASQFLSADEHDADATTQGIMRGSRVSGTDDGNRTDVRQIIAWLAPTDDPSMLGRIGTYEIAGVVGAGGMGVVLKGFDRALNRFVAIKILAPHLATSGAARRRFAREAQAAAAVVHDNVVAIHGVDEANGLPYLVMPYLRGTSLQKRLDNRGPLSVSEVLRIAMQTARGLAAAHDQGLVHRDIKPANILLDGTTERVLITDFGLARAADDASLTHSGVIAGTPYFMSPEQAEGSGIDHRSDLFSLGSSMYAMCTGRPPFRAETSWGILRRVSEATPTSIREVNPDIPEWLEGLISKLLEKSSTDRFQSASELADLLAQCLAHVQQPTVQPLPEAARSLVQPPVVRPSAGRGRAVVSASILAACVCLIAVGIWFRPDVFRSSERSAPTRSADRAVARPETNSPPREVPPVADELPEWDATAQELQHLRTSIEELDRGTSDFWK